MSPKKKTDSAQAEPEVIDLGPDAIVDRDVVVEEHATVSPVASAHEAEEHSKPASEPQPELESEQVPARRNWVWPLAALVVGAGLGGWFYRDVVAFYFPTSQVTALEQRIAGLEKATAAAVDSAAAQDRLLQQLTADVDAIESHQAGSSGESQRVADDIAGLGNRIASGEGEIAALKSQLEDLKVAAPVAPGETSREQVDLAPMTARIDALEKDLASLKAAQGQAPDLSLLSQSLADMKAKVAAGVGFKEEIDRIVRMVPAAAGLDVLVAHADVGVHTAPQLAQTLQEMTASLPAPAPVADDQSSYWSMVAGVFDGIITVRTVAETNWQDVSGKAAALAHSDKLADAIQLIEAAKGEVPPALGDWIKQAKLRLSLDEAVKHISDAVARELAARG